MFSLRRKLVLTAHPGTRLEIQQQLICGWSHVSWRGDIQIPSCFSGAATARILLHSLNTIVLSALAGSMIMARDRVSCKNSPASADLSRSGSCKISQASSATGYQGDSCHFDAGSSRNLFRFFVVLLPGRPMSQSTQPSEVSDLRGRQPFHTRLASATG